MTRLSLPHLGLLGVSMVLLASSSVSADMIPIADGRYVSARATYRDQTNQGRFDADFFQNFNATSDPEVTLWELCESSPEDTCTIGDALSWSEQISVFLPNAVAFNGHNYGRWGGLPSGDFEFDSMMRLRFRLDIVHRYQFHWEVNPGEWPAIGESRGYIRLEGPVPYLSHFNLTSGVLADSGKLGPGEYVLEARAWGQSFEEFWDGATYGGNFICIPDSTPTLRYDPEDRSVGCGGTATFSAAAACPSGTPSYQWRRNLVPLASGGRISGTTGPTLTIQNACHSDSGYYDVIVTCGGVQTPSRLAHLAIVVVPTGVEAGAASVAPAFTLRAPSPNPFGGATSLGYLAPHPVRISAAVYNAQGAMVRSLIDAVVSGEGAITWNGETGTRQRAPAGIYFMRAEGEGVRETRKVVLLK